MVYYDKEKIRAALIKTVYENNDYDCCRKIGYSDDGICFAVDKLPENGNSNWITLTIRRDEPGLYSDMPIIGKVRINRLEFADKLETVTWIVYNILTLNNY